MKTARRSTPRVETRPQNQLPIRPAVGDVADGQPPDPNFNFCECPTGYTCSQIRPFVGLGDANLSGKYCIKEGTEFDSEGDCGSVQGHFNATQCKGIGSSAAQ